MRVPPTVRVASRQPGGRNGRTVVEALLMHHDFSTAPATRTPCGDQLVSQQVAGVGDGKQLGSVMYMFALLD